LYHSPYRTYHIHHLHSHPTRRSSDLSSQMIDLVSPKDPLRITLCDLKRCRLTPIFFDTFFNLEKYLDHEQRDPFASQRDEDGMSDRKSTRLNSSHVSSSYAVFGLKKR